jgi:hypothetical protein
LENSSKDPNPPSITTEELLPLLFPVDVFELIGKIIDRCFSITDMRYEPLEFELFCAEEIVLDI